LKWESNKSFNKSFECQCEKNYSCVFKNLPEIKEKIEENKKSIEAFSNLLNKEHPAQDEIDDKAEAYDFQSS
jgi:hypothetical protein